MSVENMTMPLLSMLSARWDSAIHISMCKPWTNGASIQGTIWTAMPQKPIADLDSCVQERSSCAAFTGMRRHYKTMLHKNLQACHRKMLGVFHCNRIDIKQQTYNPNTCRTKSTHALRLFLSLSLKDNRKVTQTTQPESVIRKPTTPGLGTSPYNIMFNRFKI